MIIEFCIVAFRCFLAMKLIGFMVFLLFKFGDSSSLCPNPEDIEPCYCFIDETFGTEIICDGNLLESEIEAVFQATFPVKELYDFIIRNNELITELNLPIFNGITFESIKIYNNDNLIHINSTFFNGQENTLRILYLPRNKLDSDGFPYLVLPNVPNLISLNLESNDISSLPVPIPMNNITDLDYQNNRIKEIKQGTFESCKALTDLELSNNVIANIEKGNINSKV